MRPAPGRIAARPRQAPRAEADRVAGGPDVVLVDEHRRAAQASSSSTRDSCIRLTAEVRIGPGRVSLSARRSHRLGTERAVAPGRSGQTQSPGRRQPEYPREHERRCRRTFPERRASRQRRDQVGRHRAEIPRAASQPYRPRVAGPPRSMLRYASWRESRCWPGRSQMSAGPENLSGRGDHRVDPPPQRRTWRDCALTRCGGGGVPLL